MLATEEPHPHPTPPPYNSNIQHIIFSLSTLFNNQLNVHHIVSQALLNITQATTEKKQAEQSNHIKSDDELAKVDSGTSPTVKHVLLPILWQCD